MRVTLYYGRERFECDVHSEPPGSTRRLAVQPPRAPLEPVPDIGAAVRAALETPIGFPALRRALTPDDHVTIVVDEQLPRLAELLVPILEHVKQAQVAPSAITLLLPVAEVADTSATGRRDWLNALPEPLRGVQCRVHAPGNRKQLSYLATTKGGRRLYLNRAAVDADQVVVLSGRGYDLRLGYSGAEGSLFPAFSDDTTLAQTNNQLSMAAPAETPNSLRREAMEAAWLLGAPFFVQVIPGAGDDIALVLGGPADSCDEGVRQLDLRWRRSVTEPARTVVATVSGDPARQGFNELAAAAGCAARVVQAGGRIILLTAITPHLGPAGEMVRQAESADQALTLLHKHKPADMAAAFLWASAANHARIYLLSGLPADVAEELFALPLDHADQAARLLAEQGTCLILNDAHHMMATTE
jgi:nickel-dependent lactate racemase